MNNKVWMITLVLLMNWLLGLNCSRTNINLIKPSNLTEKTSEATDDSEKLKLLLEKFRSENKNEQEQAQKNILALSNKSVSFRNLAVQEMLKIVNSQKQSTIVCRNNCYQEWRLAVETLGMMEATEAIDSLVERLDYNDGSFGLSLSWFPAAKSVVRIGSPAIPKLTEIFSDPENELRCDLAVQVLYIIGNDEAKLALQKILDKKINSHQKAEIKRLLRNWSPENR